MWRTFLCMLNYFSNLGLVLGSSNEGVTACYGYMEKFASSDGSLILRFAITHFRPLIISPNLLCWFWRLRAISRWPPAAWMIPADMASLTSHPRLCVVTMSMGLISLSFRYKGVFLNLKFIHVSTLFSLQTNFMLYCSIICVFVALITFEWIKISQDFWSQFLVCALKCLSMINYTHAHILLAFSCLLG